MPRQPASRGRSTRSATSSSSSDPYADGTLEVLPPDPSRSLGTLDGTTTVPTTTTVDPPWKWTTARRRAAALVAAGDLTLQEIAEKVGYSSYQTIVAWKHHPTFAAEVERVTQELQAQTLTYAITRKRKRLELIEDLLQDALSFKRQRAKHLSPAQRRARNLDPLPGGDTGMVAVRYKIIRQGAETTTLEEYGWDSDLEEAITRLIKEGKEEHAEGDSSDPNAGGIRRLYIGINLDKV